MPLPMEEIPVRCRALTLGGVEIGLMIFLPKSDHPLSTTVMDMNSVLEPEGQ